MATRSYWLLKGDPDDYGFDDLEREKKTWWTGIRNFEARNHLRQMKKGDLALLYHSGDEKRVVGVVRITGEAAPDRTAPKGEDWSSVEVEPLTRLKEPVTLETIKATGPLADMVLVKRTRLSVSPVEPEQFERLLSLGKTKLPKKR